jgi:hypothetical protein
LRLFLVVTLAGQRLFNSLLLAWLQVKGVTLNFLNYVCLLQLCVKTIEERFGFLQSNLWQLKDTPRPS